MSKKKASKTIPGTNKVNKPFRILYPYLLLLIITALVYSPSVNSGFTELDDKIFIVEQENFIRDASNIIPSYSRGTFSEKNDNYYRPVLLNSFIINYQISGDDIQGYHLFNILLHLVSVLLAYALFNLLFQDRIKAFILALIFAVHPVLTQAVSWIPGRNDSLLFIFAIPFLIASVKYVQTRKASFLLLQFVTLTLALFTKETAIMVPPASFIILVTFTTFNWKSKDALLQYGSWALAGVIWFVVRSSASLRSETYEISEFPSNFIERFPLLLQYLGKIILPVNLSVFPMIRDTSYVYGIVAVILVTVAVLAARNRDNKKIIGGVGWFFLLLVPVLFLPSSINNQDFEHRLYLPIIGIFIVLGESAMFYLTKPKQVTVIGLLIAGIFSYVNIQHQSNFKDPVSFWSAAVETTPHSSYATMNLGSRMDDIDLNRSVELLKHAYDLNPDEKYINYYMGMIARQDGNMEDAEKYFKRELELSAYYETYLHLSEVEARKNNLDSSIKYLNTFLKHVPDHQDAIVNYTQMLLFKGQKEQAREFVQSRQRMGIPVPPDLVARVIE